MGKIENNKGIKVLTREGNETLYFLIKQELKNRGENLEVERAFKESWVTNIISNLFDLKNKNKLWEIY